MHPYTHFKNFKYKHTKLLTRKNHSLTYSLMYSKTYIHSYLYILSYTHPDKYPLSQTYT